MFCRHTIQIPRIFLWGLNLPVGYRAHSTGVFQIIRLFSSSLVELSHVLPPSEAVHPEVKPELPPESQADVEKEKQLIREVSWLDPLEVEGFPISLPGKNLPVSLQQGLKLYSCVAELASLHTTFEPPAAPLCRDFQAKKVELGHCYSHLRVTRHLAVSNPALFVHFKHL